MLRVKSRLLSSCALPLWLVMVAACGGPAMPCKYADTDAPEHRTGTFMVTESGATRTGTLDVTIATNQLVDQGPLSPVEASNLYRCEAAGDGTMRFDDTGEVIQLNGGEGLDIAYESSTGVNPDVNLIEGVGFAGGGYVLDAGGYIRHNARDTTTIGKWTLSD
jgi:hypothetical protein